MSHVAFVTGVAGFIGSAVARSLIDKGWTVHGVDDFSTGKVENIPLGVNFRQIPAESPACAEFLKAVMANVVFHIGGQSSGEIGENEPLRDINSNVVSTLNLLAAARSTGVARFLYASSMGVYGNCLKAESLDEGLAGSPISIYGAGKWAAEQYLRLFANPSMKCVALRMFNVYGPGQNMTNSKQGMVSIFLQQAVDDRRVVVRGSLERIRDFIFIDDVVSAWINASEVSISDSFTAVNVGSGKGLSVRSLLDSISSAVGQIEIELAPSTPADQSKTVACIRRAETKLKWKPLVELNTGIRSFVTWYLKAKNGA